MFIVSYLAFQKSHSQLLAGMPNQYQSINHAKTIIYILIAQYMYSATSLQQPPMYSIKVAVVGRWQLWRGQIVVKLNFGDTEN